MTVIAVTGTDTGVGKTVIARAMCAALQARGMRVGAMKPVETGVEAHDGGTDAQLLADAAGTSLSLELLRPYSFRTPVAPLVAARIENEVIDSGRLDAAFAHIRDSSDVTVVEGAGGLLVPITADLDFAALFARWQANVVIVAMNRLGAVNHTLLTLRMARTLSLRVAAIVLHDGKQGMNDDATRTNASLISELSAPTPVVRFPWIEGDVTRTSLIDAAEKSGLMKFLIPTQA